MSICDSQLCDADKKKVTERTLYHREYAIQNCNICVFLLIFVEKTRHNKHYVVLLRLQQVFFVMKGYFYVICHSVCHLRDIHDVVAYCITCSLHLLAVFSFAFCCFSP